MGLFWYEAVRLWTTAKQTESQRTDIREIVQQIYDKQKITQ